jgi:uncharacterized protein YdcH (DUF465 family)
MDEGYMQRTGLHILVEDICRHLCVVRPIDYRAYVLRLLKAHKSHTQRIAEEHNAVRETTKGLTDVLDQIAAIRKRNLQYVDTSFPPVPSSAGTNEPVWRRSTEIYPKDLVHVLDTIEPLDVNMNDSRETWLASAIAALAEFPDLIKRLLDPNADTSFGLHRVTINNGGWWTRILLDDYFPCNCWTGMPMSVFSKSNELWPGLIEKAYAKLYGGYNMLKRGSFSQAMIDLTGMPSTVYRITDDIVQRPDDIFSLILQSDQVNRAMGAITRDNIPPTDGLISNMSYSLLNARQVKGHKLVQLRNPWGRFEWTGDWSDKSPLWTDEIRLACGWSDADDGTFWISIQDFVKRFWSVTITQVEHDWHEIRMVGSFQGGLPDAVLEVNPSRGTVEENLMIALHTSWTVRRTKGAGIIICGKDTPDGPLKPIAMSTGCSAMVHATISTKSLSAKGPVYLVPYPLFVDADEDFVLAFHSKAKTTAFRTLRAVGTANDIRGLISAAVVNATSGIPVGKGITCFTDDFHVVIRNTAPEDVAVKIGRIVVKCPASTASLIASRAPQKQPPMCEIVSPIPKEAKNPFGQCSVMMAACTADFAAAVDPGYTIPTQIDGTCTLRPDAREELRKRLAEQQKRRPQAVGCVVGSVLASASQAFSL